MAQNLGQNQEAMELGQIAVAPHVAHPTISAAVGAHPDAANWDILTDADRLSISALNDDTYDAARVDAMIRLLGPTDQNPIWAAFADLVKYQGFDAVAMAKIIWTKPDVGQPILVPVGDGVLENIGNGGSLSLILGLLCELGAIRGTNIVKMVTSMTDLGVRFVNYCQQRFEIEANSRGRKDVVTLARIMACFPHMSLMTMWRGYGQCHANVGDFGLTDQQGQAVRAIFSTQLMAMLYGDYIRGPNNLCIFAVLTAVRLDMKINRGRPTSMVDLWGFCKAAAGSGVLSDMSRRHYLRLTGLIGDNGHITFDVAQCRRTARATLEALKGGDATLRFVIEEIMEGA